jgi:hypothetical protein
VGKTRNTGTRNELSMEDVCYLAEGIQKEMIMEDICYLAEQNVRKFPSAFYFSLKLHACNFLFTFSQSSSAIFKLPYQLK